MTDFILSIIFIIIITVAFLKNENKIETWLKEVTHE